MKLFFSNLQKISFTNELLIATFRNKKKTVYALNKLSLSFVTCRSKRQDIFSAKEILQKIILCSGEQEKIYENIESEQ